MNWKYSFKEYKLLIFNTKWFEIMSGRSTFRDCSEFIPSNPLFLLFISLLWKTILRAKQLNVEDVNLELRPHRSNKNLELLRLVTLFKFK